MAEATSTDPRQLKVHKGLQFVQTLRPALYALLVLSALFTFWAGGDIGGRALPAWTQIAAPALFAVFLVVFAYYRIALVRAKRYPAATGLFQVGLGALIWVLLLPGSRQKIAPPPPGNDDLPALMVSSDPRVRALAAEVAPSRPEPGHYAAALIDRLDDSDDRVREQSHRSLVKLFGTDAAPGEQGAAAMSKWRALAQSRGWLR